MMKSCLVGLLSVLFCFCFIGLHAQFLQDQSSGTAYRMSASLSNVDGSPFFSQDWIKGVVKIKDGDTFKDVALKYDMYNEILLFQGKSNEELMFVKPVEEFTLSHNGVNRTFRNLSYADGVKGGNAYYELLYDGQVSLYRKIKKEIVESSEYGSNAVSRRFDDVESYHTSRDGNLLKIKLDKKSIIEVLDSAQKNQLEDFIKQEGLKLKSEQDVVRLLEYYNALKAQ